MALAGPAKEDVCEGRGHCDVWRDTDSSALYGDAGSPCVTGCDEDDDDTFDLLVACVAESREVSCSDDTHPSPLCLVQDWWLARQHDDITRAACALPIPANDCVELDLADESDILAACAYHARDVELWNYTHP